MENKTLFEGANSKSTRITGYDNDNFIELFNPLLFLQSKIDAINLLYEWDCILKIEGFRLLIAIKSLPVAPFPDIYPEDSTGVRNNKLLQTEYHNPNMIFRLFKSQNGIEHETGDIYLQNKGMQYHKSLIRPYLCDGNIPVKLWGINDILKCKLIDSGSGLLGFNDYLQIEIDYSYIINGIRKVGINVNPLNFAKLIRVGFPQLLIGANQSRVKLSFKNDGESPVSFAFGNQA
ncbi:MAG TPA: hypothetical protein V6D21_14470, partial [Candidatus Obscuribacterales bacterium]